MELKKRVLAFRNRVERAVCGRLGRHLNPNRWANRINNMARVLNERRMRKFLADTDFDAIDVSQYHPTMNIVVGGKIFQFVDAYFFTTTLTSIAYCLFCKQLPNVQMRNSKGENLWEMFLEQPYAQAQTSLEERVNSGEALLVCSWANVGLRIPHYPTQEDVRDFAKLYRPPILTFNERTRAYIEDEYEGILAGGGAS